MSAGDRAVACPILIGYPLALDPVPPLAILVVVLALLGSFSLGLRLGRVLKHIVVVSVARSGMDADSQATVVGMERGPGGGSASAGSSTQLEIVTELRSSLPFPGKGGDGKMTVQYLDM
jgi:hypothetical protein